MMLERLRLRMAQLLAMIAMVKMYLAMLEEEAQELAKEIEEEEGNESE